jgi:REP element-mobilizing transposase RayT
MIKGWHSRGYLPHYDNDRRIQFVTFRLYDSLPKAVLVRLVEQARLEAARGEGDRHPQRLIEKFLDTGAGECFLRLAEVAEVVERGLLSLDASMISLRAWVIMPNHVHLLLLPLSGQSMTKIMQSIKGATAKEANELLGRTGSFWMRDYFDRYIRDAEHYGKAVRYIENNPVKAGLCKRAADWRFGRAWWREREEEAN